MKKTCVLGLLAAAPFLLAVPETRGTELVYVPVNPSFGGSPLNGSFLLSQAESQNKFKNQSNAYTSDPFTDFEDTLNRRILGILANEIVEGAFGEEGGLQEGHFEIGDFVIDVVPNGNGVNVVISDPSTGRQTTVNIPEF